MARREDPTVYPAERIGLLKRPVEKFDSFPGRNLVIDSRPTAIQMGGVMIDDLPTFGGAHPKGGAGQKGNQAVLDKIQLGLTNNPIYSPAQRIRCFMAGNV